MKSSPALSWCAALAAVALGSLAPTGNAQMLTSTGVVLSTSAEKATVTIRSDQSRRQLIIPGMRGARVMHSSGKPAQFSDVQSGMLVSISYAVRDGRWVVGALYIPDPPPPGSSPLDRLWLLTPGQRWASSTKAGRDRDITTQPGSRALIANDITVRPGRRALFGDDRTLKAPRTAVSDGDITTKAPGQAGLDGDITKKAPRSVASDQDITTRPTSRNAVTDGDITTKAPRQAGLDGDITRKPPGSVATDRDITTRPGTRDAARDGDITTKPPRSAAFDNDITTQPGNR